MKKVIFIVAVIISIFTINNLIRSIYSLWQKQDVLVQAKEDLRKKQQKNLHLKEQLGKVNSEEFIEAQARDKLLMVKPGETMVVVPTELIARSKPPVVKKAPPKPNWQQWWEYFF